MGVIGGNLVKICIVHSLEGRYVLVKGSMIFNRDKRHRIAYEAEVSFAIRSFCLLTIQSAVSPMSADVHYNVVIKK